MSAVRRLKLGCGPSQRWSRANLRAGSLAGRTLAWLRNWGKTCHPSGCKNWQFPELQSRKQITLSGYPVLFPNPGLCPSLSLFRFLIPESAITMIAVIGIFFLVLEYLAIKL